MKNKKNTTKPMHQKVKSPISMRTQPQPVYQGPDEDEEQLDRILTALHPDNLKRFKQKTVPFDPDEISMDTILKTLRTRPKTHDLKGELL